MYSDTKGAGVVQSSEAQAFSQILDETCEEDVESPIAMLSDQQTFGETFLSKNKEQRTNKPLVMFLNNNTNMIIWNGGMIPW